MQPFSPIALIIPILTAASLLTGQGTGTAVVPRVETAGGFGNTSSSYPWNRKTSSIRVQYIYDASEMPRFPVTITSLRFRPNDLASTATSWSGGTYGGLTIQMSTAAVDWDKLTTTFATNHGGDLTTVFAGSAALSAGNGTGWGTPSQPYVSINLSTPFPYDPAGGPLLLDIGSDGSQYTGGSTTNTAITTGSHKTSRMFNLSSHAATTGTLQSDLGMVVEFDYTFTGTFPLFSANRTAVPTGTQVQFTDETMTSSPLGVLTYAWDLDGDGNTDATTKDPTFVYNTPGVYDIELSVVSGHGAFTRKWTGYIRVADPVSTEADLLQYQFNETRDPVAANSATGNKAPVQGTVTGSGWQGDAMGPAFGPNEPGFGMLRHAGSTNTHYVESGHDLNETGSLTVAWWQRLTPNAVRNTFAYAWGPASGSNLRCFNSGDAGDSVMLRGSAAIGHFHAGVPIRRLGIWVHICLVIDDAAGLAQWYIDGDLAAAKNFTPGAFDESSTNFQVGKRLGSGATHANFYDLDDFRMYTRALSLGEVLGLVEGEAPSSGNFGTSCVSSGTPPMIASAGGVPRLGNGSFRAEMTGAPASAPYAMVLGFQADAGGTLPLDISAILGAGCLLETDVFLLDLGTASAAGAASLALPIPNDSRLIGLHAYVQGAFDAGAMKGATDLLDVNIQK